MIINCRLTLHLKSRLDTKLHSISFQQVTYDDNISFDIMSKSNRL